MCIGCWDMQGSPTVLPETAEEILALIRELHARPFCDDGGPLHEELYEWQITHRHWTPRPDPDLDLDVYDKQTMNIAKEICRMMLDITIKERAAVLGLYYGFFEEHDD